VADNLDVGSGVTLFEFCDEWWKAGDPSAQDPGGAAPNSGGVPYDGAANEEYWGVVDVFRGSKLSFAAVTTVYTGDLCLVSAHAGPDQYLPMGTTGTTLDGSASSHSGPLSYEWSQTGGPTPVSFSSSSAEQPLVSGLSAGDYSFSLTVTGDCGSSTDAVEVWVAATANIAPVADAGPDQFLTAGSTSTTLDGSASFDPDGGPAPLSYSWTQTAGPALSISSAAAMDPIVAGIVGGQSYTFALVVSDGLQPSSPASVTLYGDPIFVDGFETGDTSMWSSTQPGPGKHFTTRSFDRRPGGCEQRRYSCEG
jgi:hypothetical protein